MQNQTISLIPLISSSYFNFKKNTKTNCEANTTIVITFITHCVIWVTVKIGEMIEYNRMN